MEQVVSSYFVSKTSFVVSHTTSIGSCTKLKLCTSRPIPPPLTSLRRNGSEGYQTFCYRKTILYENIIVNWEIRKTFPLYNQHVRSILHSIITFTMPCKMQWGLGKSKECTASIVQIHKCVKTDNEHFGYQYKLKTRQQPPSESLIMSKILFKFSNIYSHMQNINFANQ